MTSCSTVITNYTEKFIAVNIDEIKHNVIDK